jgi:hypothetical protein
MDESVGIGSGSAAWVTRTALYRVALERRREVERHKWYESERAGYDIGWDRAVVDWAVRFGCGRPRDVSREPG